MTRTQAKAGRSKRCGRQSCSGPDWGRVLSVPAAGSRIVADGSFYQREPATSAAVPAQGAKS
jgi:hypothetical protein